MEHQPEPRNTIRIQKSENVYNSSKETLVCWGTINRSVREMMLSSKINRKREVLRDSSTRMKISYANICLRASQEKSEMYNKEVKTKSEKKRRQKRKTRHLLHAECGHYYFHGNDDWILSAACKVRFYERYYN
jgi:hypothetical protein